MSGFEPERPDGAIFHECEACGGTGEIQVRCHQGKGGCASPGVHIHVTECEDCDGTGEWFE